MVNDLHLRDRKRKLASFAVRIGNLLEKPSVQSMSRKSAADVGSVRQHIAGWS